MTKEQEEICKKHFNLFTYYIKSEEHRCNSSYLKSTTINFLNDENLQELFNLYSLFEDDKIFLIEEQERRIGFTTFLCYLMYYKGWSSLSSSAYITNNSLVSDIVEKLTHFVLMFKPITKLDSKYKEVKRLLEFSNGSTINFLSDITYDLKTVHKVYDLLIFDNATMKNFDKLTHTIEMVINKQITNKAIINFNCLPPLFKGSEDFDYLVKEFKNYISLITVKK